ncbi:protein boule-like [Centroberyx affinis]|uniref:protein boule-like n=1 Tax=Centroberyx affinis TaxID=166261 RepID=UPI003A5B9BC0
MESQTAFMSCCPSQTGAISPYPDPASPENPSSTPAPTHYTPCLGTIIPNRIFVGGIDFKINENDLRRIFSQHGAVKQVKIVIDRSGMSKGYGFVTFETQEDAQKILQADAVCFRDKKLNIGQAVRKQQAAGHGNSVAVASGGPAVPLPMPCGTLHLTTSTGYPYTYHNGVAYFHNPDMNPPAHHWPSGSPMMLPHPHQPVYQQPAYHHYQVPPQCVPNYLQWNVHQSPVASSPVVYTQPSDYLYQPTDGGSVQPPLPALEGTIPEDQMFPSSLVHLKPKYHRYANRKDYTYLPEPSEPTDPSMLHPLM